MKIGPLGAELSCGLTDWQTGVTKLIVVFRNFANVRIKLIIKTSLIICTPNQVRQKKLPAMYERKTRRMT